jgi:hypothetical protein
MSVPLPSEPLNEDVHLGRWLAGPKRLFAVGWASAVVVATAGWLYCLLRIIWYAIGALLP